MPLRLTVVGPGHPFRGGIARATTELVLALRERGHAVRFLTPQRQYPGWLYPGGSDRDPDACQAVEGAEAVLDPFAPGSWPQARCRALEPRADAWILPYWTWAWAGLWRFLLAARGRPPAVAVVHNPADHDARPWQRLAARSVLGRCQGLFTHARVLARELEARYPSLPVGSHPLPAAAAGPAPGRATARADLGLPAEARVALFLGLIRPYKGVDLLVEAAAAAEATDPGRIGLVLVGDGPEHEEVKRAAASATSAVRVVAPVPKSDVPAVLRALDAAVVHTTYTPVYRYGISFNKLFEYMAAERPVVFATSTAYDPVAGSGAGITVEPDDAGRLAASFLEMAATPSDERLAMGIAGRRYVEREHDFDRLGETLAAIVEGRSAER